MSLACDNFVFSPLAFSDELEGIFSEIVPFSVTWLSIRYFLLGVIEFSDIPAILLIIQQLLKNNLCS